MQLGSYWVAGIMFVVVWSTAAIPAYVSEHYYASVQRKLAAVAHATTIQSTTEPQDVASTALMQRVAAAKSGTGMHFAGVPMSVEKAVSVGTVLFYLTRYAAAHPESVSHTQYPTPAPTGSI